MTLFEQKFITKIAQEYYRKGKTQEEIALKFRISRSKVSRLISKARECGMVTFTIKDMNEDIYALENEIENLFGLQEVIIVPSNINSQQTLRAVANGAGLFLDRVLRNGDILGVSWGSTLREMVNLLQPTRKINIRVVPLVGGVGQTMTAVSYTHLTLPTICSV